MKKAAIFVLAAMLVAVCVPAFAQQFPDVPQDHWAYAAVQDIVGKGIIQGYPDGTFSGKRAMTRYEFAQAIEKAIPIIAGMANGAGVPGPQGPAGPQGDPGVGVSKDVIDNLQKLVGEFSDELSALNVDVQGLKRDLAALAQRVAAVEAEQARVKITAEYNMIVRGLVNTGGPVIEDAPFVEGDGELAIAEQIPGGSDIDGRLLAGRFNGNPLSANAIFEDFQLGIKGKVSNSASVVALISAGNYLNYALGSGGSDGLTGNAGLNDFTLWNLYADAGVKLGPLGNAQLVAGRFPFQLTPLTLKMVTADSYNYVSIIDNGDYAVDGARVSFNLGKIGLTAFAAKSGQVDTSSTTNENLGVFFAEGGNVSMLNQFAGVRAVVGTPLNGKLGLTYAQFGAVDPIFGDNAGQLQVFGADFKGNISKLSIGAEVSNSRPNDAMNDMLQTDAQSQNLAWNAKLGYDFGKLQIGGGWSQIQRNFLAPGYWSKTGKAINLQNVEGPSVDLTYVISPRMSFCANGDELKPVDSNIPVFGRTTTFGTSSVRMGPGVLDKVDHWSAGIKYALTAANSVDLGYEEVQWKPTADVGTTKEKYLTLGLGHSFNANSSLKAFYQIVEYTGNRFDPYEVGLGTRGGVAGAQFQLKY